MRDDPSSAPSPTIVWGTEQRTVQVDRSGSRTTVLAPIRLSAVRAIEAAKGLLTEAEYEALWERFGL